MRTRILLLCFCVVSYLYSIAQPANNDCGSAIAITTLDGTCLTGNDVTAATEDLLTGACSVGDNENVWFSFTAQGVSAEIQVNNGPGTPEITVIQFTGGACNAGGAVEIDCSTGTPLQLDNQLVVGTTYYVMVAFSNNADGFFDICIDNPVPASNDACFTATPLVNLNNACYTSSNEWPSTDVLVPGCFSGSTWNVWFSFVAEGVSLDAYIPTGGPGVAQLAVIDFATNCDIAGSTVLGCATGTNHIVLDNVLTIGQLYFIVVGFQNSDWDDNGIGSFELCVDNPEPAPNDECDMSIVIPSNVLDDPTTCYTSIAGNPLNNDWPSTDVGLFNCWNAGDSYNIWYSFVAQGPDVEITVDPVFNEDPQIALVEFTGTPCEFAGAVLLDCANASVLDYNDQLVVGQTYYIAVGFENNGIGDFCMNVFNPEPPPNDLPCNAITLSTTGNCEDGTTVYANPEALFAPPACQNAIDNIVWYEISLADPDNVGFIIDLALEDINPTSTVSVFLYPGTDCNNIPNPVYFYCGDPPTEPIEFGPVDNITYLLAIGTSEPNETDFEICVDEIPPCFTNDICEEATVINNVMSDMPFVCVEGCNLFADPEAFNNSCEIGTFSTVWFQVPTDGAATLMNIFVTSDDFDAPTISLFWQTSDCSALTPVPLTNSNLPCVVGSNGEAEALGTDVGASSIYYIAVSSLNNVGGEFELCVNTISAASNCVTAREIVITNRSSGGPLEGPFFPGETVSICMNVNSYTAANNGCQWFQGLIPVFGNGWDPSSFDAYGQPLNATVNGNTIGQLNNGLYSTSTWDWFLDVDYHHNHVFYQLGDFDGNGTTDMCNLLFDPDCPNTGGLTGGCCNPCWGSPLGTILPGGWFAYGINGSCGTPGPPIRVDWGDGNTCGGGMGPWEFCFDLNVRDYPDCLDNPTTMDLKLGFFTTADGETGAWTGSASVCALDQPAFVTLPMCCSELMEAVEELDPICSEQQFVYSIDEPDVDFWQWTVAGGGVTGGLPGSGGPGTIIIHTLTNPGTDVETVIYTFLGFAGGACPVFQKEVMIDVYPEIVATIDPLVMCSTPTNPYVIAPDVMGGTGNYEYQWAPGGETTATIMVPNPVNGTTYTVSITDEAGCFSTASVAIEVYTTFPVDIIAPIIEQCIQDGPITIEATATGGMDPYAFEWTLPGGGMPTTEEVITSETGQHLVVVTDDEGCVGRDSVIITLNETPEIYIDAVGGILALCENQSTQLTGVATEGESPYYYEWDTPDGPESGKTITAFSPGVFTVTVEDANGCSAVSDIAIEAQPEPQPDLGPDILVCNFEYEVELTVSEQFEDYAWSVGSGADGLQTIGVYVADTYTVTVTNEFGCTGTDDVEVGTFPQPLFPIPDTFEICPGATITVNADDYGGPWENFQWDQCPGCVNEIDISGPGEFQVTVFDENNCSAYAEFSVVETATISPGLTGDNVICVGAGESTTLAAQLGFDTYDWSPGNQNTPSISVNVPGTYTVQVEDDMGCIGIDSIVVISGDFNASVAGPMSICANVLATLTATPNFSTYVWSTGDMTQSVMVDDGTHSVTITNVDGCMASTSVTVIETPFVPVITGDNMICQTSESTTLDAGGPHPLYQWSANAGGAITQTITTSTAGDYFVTVTDISGCVGTAAYTVGNHPVPFVAISGIPDFCVGGDTEMSATGGYPAYVWNTMNTNDTIVINTAGNYAVTITDGNGCTNTTVVTVNPPYQETVDITGSFVFCPGDQATLEVPAGYQSVLWSTTESTDQIFVSTEGDISVIVVDVDGCIAYDTVTTDANAVLSPNIVGPGVICDNGPGVLNAGPGFDSYLWSNGLGTNQNATITAAGTYTVTVTDGSCQGTDDFVVTSNVSPFAAVTPTATACNVQEAGGPSTIVNFNGLVTAGDTGGNWIQTGGPGTVNLGTLSAVNFSGQVPGVYTFTYTTASAVAPCTDRPYTMSVTVNDCACPALQLGLAPDLCNDLGSINLNTLLTGGTQTDGTWTIVSAPAGSNPATITSPNFNASNADPGAYTLQYQIAGLPVYCPDVATLSVNVLRDPVAGIAAAPAQFCAGENQTVDLFTMLIGADAGGEWHETSQNMSTGGAFNPATGRFSVVGQQPGTYTFSYVITGPGPCPDDMTTVEVVIENNPVADAGATAILNCNLTSVQIGGSGTSVGPEFVYSWVASGGGTITDPNVLYATASSQGTYTLTVMNTVTGCSASDQVVIDQVGNFPTDLDMLVQSPDCVGDPPGSAQVSAVIGGVGPFSYSLNGGLPVSSPVFPNLESGNYSLQVTDATGCTLTETFTIFDLVNVDLEILHADTLIFDFEDTIKLSYAYIGSTAIPDSLVWKSGDSVICINCQTLAFQANLAGQITLEAYDLRGCFIEKTINYLVVRERDVYIPNVFSPNGDDLNDRFTLFTDADVTEITVMEVYTRWGDLVFKAGPIPPNDPNLGWDGTFRGEELNPGVYVYRIEILYGDGLVDKLAGDITIVK